jgi:dTDP-4-amino-4,6-dideoxygalactose transaminase
MSWTLTPPVGERIPLLGTARAPDLTFGGRYRVLLTGSGTQALAAALLAARARASAERNEVLLPAYQCPDLVTATQFAGTKARAIDVEAGRPWMDPSSLQDALGKQTLAIIAPAFLGAPERLERITASASAAGAVVIEDSAQLFPRNGQHQFVAPLVVLSFGRGKPASAMGGGALLYTNAYREAVEKLVLAPVAGGGLEYQAKCVAYNVCRTPLLYRAISKVLGLGKAQFKTLDALTTMPPAPLARLSSIIDGLPVEPTPAQRALAAMLRNHGDQLTDLGEEISGSPPLPLLRYPILFRDEQAAGYALQLLDDQGIGATRLYAQPLQEIQDVPPLAGGPWPNAAAFAARLITLPLHSGIGAAHVARIDRALRQLRELKPRS